MLGFNLLAATLKSFKIKELRGEAVSACEKPAKVSEETDLPNDLPQAPDFQPAMRVFLQACSCLPSKCPLDSVSAAPLPGTKSVFVMM